MTVSFKLSKIKERLSVFVDRGSLAKATSKRTGWLENLPEQCNCATIRFDWRLSINVILSHFDLQCLRIFSSI